ncbi:hypothetical protein E2C01_066008 [Portunus trituberculatus]|uniref:Uncharacterized protein n=1 Tax=Portunus trituberculatus TaxID=210409 RepID=A0A5B7HKD1_PORTR|nr:hypothetical protein [Portunus trituberculatus]
MSVVAIPTPRTAPIVLENLKFTDKKRIRVFRPNALKSLAGQRRHKLQLGGSSSRFVMDNQPPSPPPPPPPPPQQPLLPPSS